MTDVFDHAWLGGLFADAEMAFIWSAETQLVGMRAFEVAWARALGNAGVVEPSVAANTAGIILSMQFDIDELRAGTARDGVVVPRLVLQMEAAAALAKAAVHRGATSQDVVDTATAIAMRDSLALLATRLAALEDALRKLDARFGAEKLMGRTRMQAATEITVHDRIAPWLLPLADHRTRLAELRPRVAKVQIGGASGDRRVLGDKAGMIAADVAQQLGLGNPSRSWHAMRDGVAEFASFLSLLTGTTGKMGQDMALMAQQGISEITLSGGGSSSAMPHKQNPVLAELLVTLARYNAVQLSATHQAMVHEQERSGAAWMLEWMVLPQMAQAAARSLAVGQTLVSQVNRIGSL